ncbi:MAG TPA: SDR family NAD(P)-dependent oxidoreductase [Steroidobacteraceae bacterium]|jgi:3-hydroxybutyrate dehydrogenase
MAEDRPLTGRRALITGSTGGLGAAMAQALAGAGADIMLTGLESLEQVEPQRLDMARSHGVRVEYHRADLQHAAEVQSLVTAAKARLGGVDILINNAVVRHFAPIEAFPVAQWDAALAVNVSAAFHATRLLLPDMRRQGYGRIFNMSSVYGSRGTPERVDYVTSKAAIQGFTRAVAAETRSGDVSCHALCPGSVLSPASERRINALMQQHGLSRAAAEARFLEGKQPSGRFISLQSISQVLLLLCGPAGRDMNGAMIPIDGGWLAGE